MLLTINRKFEFAAAHKHWRSDWDTAKNHRVFGRHAKGKYGHGHNFLCFLGFTGDIDPETGMILELSQIKTHANKGLFLELDHRYLNEDVSFFHSTVPTLEHICQYIYTQLPETFSTMPIRPVFCHLQATSRSASTVFGGRLLRHVIIGRDTRYTFDGNLDRDTGCLVSEDHILSLKPMTGCLDLCSAISDACCGVRVSLSESVSLDYLRNKGYMLTFKETIYATHRLKNTFFSDQENQSCYGKCSAIHGHDFQIECRVRLLEAPTNARISDMSQRFSDWVAPFNYCALDEEVSLFKEMLCTCENMITRLYGYFNERFEGQVDKLVFQETPNNRFSIRV